MSIQNLIKNNKDQPVKAFTVNDLIEIQVKMGVPSTYSFFLRPAELTATIEYLESLEKE